MPDTLKLEHFTIDKAIDYHSTWFEYSINMLHLAAKALSDRGGAADTYRREAADHAAILAELRHHKSLELP